MKLFYERRNGFYFAFHINELDFPPHIHNAVEIVFLQEGSSTAHCGKDCVNLSAGDIFIAFPNQIHSYENSKDTYSYLLILPVKPCMGPFAHIISKQEPETCYLRRGTWEHTGLWHLLERAYEDRMTAFPEVMQAYMQVIFGKLLPLLRLRDTADDKNEVVRTILEYLGAHYRQPLTRTQIARTVGYHENYISHVFSKTLNTTLPEYINALRVYDASALLLETDLSVAEIAAELGFGSIRNFNRVFQKEIGMSPRAYRNTGGKPSILD